MTPSPLPLLLQLGDNPAPIRQRCGNFDAMFIDAAGLESGSLIVVRPFLGEFPDEPGKYSCAILTGSHSMVTDREGWSEKLKPWLIRAVDSGLPMFAVCYGHQLLAEALGGKVDYHPDGDEIGTLDIILTGPGQADPFLSDCQPFYKANLYHSQTVVTSPTARPFWRVPITIHTRCSVTPTTCYPCSSIRNLTLTP